jgi:membrane protein implicated in regulation of membrane protease activity
MHTCYNIAVTRGRLIIAIITTLLDDILILVLLFIGLPYFGIHLPLALIIGIALLWIVIAVFLYLVGGKVLKKKPLVGFTDMVNSKGKVVRAIAPEGMVKIKGELWSAKSERESIGRDEDVIVTGQDSLTLTVKKYNKDSH